MNGEELETAETNLARDVRHKGECEGSLQKAAGRLASLAQLLEDESTSIIADREHVASTINQIEAGHIEATTALRGECCVVAVCVCVCVTFSVCVLLVVCHTVVWCVLFHNLSCVVLWCVSVCRVWCVVNCALCLREWVPGGYFFLLCICSCSLVVCFFYPIFFNCLSCWCRQP
jgi:hypothetical protein